MYRHFGHAQLDCCQKSRMPDYDYAIFIHYDRLPPAIFTERCCDGVNAGIVRRGLFG